MAGRRVPVRDILVREEPLMLKPGQLYVIAAVLGVSGFGLFSIVLQVPPVPAAVASIAITFVFRMLAVFYDWKTSAVIPKPAED